MKAKSLVGGALLLVTAAQSASVPQPKFRSVEIDNRIQIGYGVAVADVDGDGKQDIVLADKNQFVWYRNPNWNKFVLAENLTKLDNVCIAARDTDGDGKAEIAVGGGWNPNDTVNSGAVFYLLPPADRTQKWDAIPLPHVPTIHRMRWVEGPGGFELVSVPLHGDGNKNADGEGVPIITYKRPADPRQSWTSNTLVKKWHKTHNFDPAGADLWVGAKEGIFRIHRENDFQMVLQVATNDVGGFGEVRLGKGANGAKFLSAVEPMHGTNLAIFLPPPGSAKQTNQWTRRVLDSSLADGHALACGDLLGLGLDQIVVGWRAMGNPRAKVGIRLFIPTDPGMENWRSELVDDNAMACEDLCLADLDRDGRLDIVAAGRGTKNVKIYFNESTK